MATEIVDHYRAVRRFTRELAEPLTHEDQSVQPMPDASPTKWHLAHTTWFFETFVLCRFDRSYRVFDPHYAVLFNSYYNGVGEQHPRAARGLLSRPSLGDVHRYREHVDGHMSKLLSNLGEYGPTDGEPDVPTITALGLHHEQQHQELLLTDAKYVLWSNPLRPAYRAATPPAEAPPPPLSWKRYDEGLALIGHDGDGFAFDNERPRHRVFLEAFELGSRLVTNGEYAEFVADDGYRRPELWLSDGWAMVQSERWTAPLYWRRSDGAWSEFSLGGTSPLDPHAPAAHLSHYEADAFARWAGARLPTEAEWERAASTASMREGNFLESGRLAPAPLTPPPGPDKTRPRADVTQLFGDVWEWTASPYVGYPRYRAAAGALGEYNGKFMCNQLVLRGGSCFTPRSHIRATYRNFFPSNARWQMSGVRLARWT